MGQWHNAYFCSIYSFYYFFQKMHRMILMHLYMMSMFLISVLKWYIQKGCTTLLKLVVQNKKTLLFITTRLFYIKNIY